MIFNKSQGVEQVKKCKVERCNNLVPEADKYEYCLDPICLENRNYKADKRKYVKEHRQRISVYPPTINLKIPKRTHLIGKTITIRCCSKGINGRCENKIIVPYILGKRYYPKYCENHRNQYKRERFETVCQKN